MHDVQQDRLQKLYSDSWMTRLRAYVGRRYNDFGDWEGWFEEAHQNLALKCTNMPAEQPLDDALIFAIFKNELISVKRNRLGYPRPRAWLRQFSELGQDLFDWMCLQQLSRAKTIELATQKARAKAYLNVTSQAPQNTEFNTHTPSDSSTERSPSHMNLLTELTDTMIEKKECDGVKPSTTDIDDESVGQIAADTPSTEETAEHAQLSLLLSMMLGADNVTNEIKTQAADRLQNLRRSLGDETLLSDMDILILRCYYFQGMSQNDIAKLVSLPIQKVVRQRESAIKRIRGFMEAHGLNRESFEF